MDQLPGVYYQEYQQKGWRKRASEKKPKRNHEGGINLLDLVRDEHPPVHVLHGQVPAARRVNHLGHRELVHRIRPAWKQTELIFIEVLKDANESIKPPLCGRPETDVRPGPYAQLNGLLGSGLEGGNRLRAAPGNQ